MGKVEINIGSDRGGDEHERGMEEGYGEKYSKIHPAMVAELLNKVEIGSLTKIVMKITGSEAASLDDVHRILEEMDEEKLAMLKMKLVEKIKESGAEPDEMDDEDEEKRMKMRSIEKDMLKFSRQKQY